MTGPPSNDRDARPDSLEAELTALLSDNPDLSSLVQQGALDGVSFWNLHDPDEQWMSPDFWDLLGRDPGTVAHDQTKWQDAIFADDRQAALEGLGTLRDDPDHVFDNVQRYRHADGPTIWIRCRGVAIRQADGAPSRMLGIHTDITPHMRTKAQAEQDRTALTEALADMKAFSYGLSHDLQSPLQSCMFFVEEIRRQLDAGDIAMASEMAAIASNRLGTLSGKMDDALSFATALDSHDGEWERLAISEIAGGLIDDLSNTELGQGASIRLVGDAHVIAHRGQLEGVLRHLVENSLKYADPGRPLEVTITARSGPEAVQIEVADTGTGIEAEYHDYVFQPFKRLKSNDAVDGSGLGLAVCKRVVERHGGAITLSSVPGEGTLVRLTLPDGLHAKD